MFETGLVVEHFGDYAVVFLTGVVDLTVESEILDAYADALGLTDRPHLIVDVSGVTFMDSAFLNTLAAALNRVEPRCGTVSLAGATERTMRLLRIVHLDGAINVLRRDRSLVRAVQNGAQHHVAEPSQVRMTGPQ